MAVKVKQVIEDVKQLSAQDRALVAHCLITSLEAPQEETVDHAWAELADRRYSELISGDVKPVKWAEIRKQVVG
ncbi:MULTISPECIES: addiction module protein [unclassified Oceanispirochaeta]|uniref:addiction module protein n=1 Tax=unclassified Oceanispirochaeta TaxID=2635722 RepID=UPI000E0918B3|nr:MULTISPECIES: addiction module protein [unclassified Oceanispirochaeta]MBF9018819.1 addiction module protein [Oceanispirochaeta sp. M2]NPD75288.1 addiction module protein [Oceanispirochaeta sp. M1]RDG28848.1 addiction module antitoxin RelB [Oceanispirochaeta sp. M1]